MKHINSIQNHNSVTPTVHKNVAMSRVPVTKPKNDNSRERDLQNDGNSVRVCLMLQKQKTVLCGTLR